jgi:hypothetical protein
MLADAKIALSKRDVESIRSKALLQRCNLFSFPRANNNKSGA